jgi:uncharacterized protein YxjI
MEIKIQCGCGTKYKFDVEPVHNRMPVKVQCPNCGNDGTTDANLYLARTASPTPVAAPSAPVPGPRLRLSGRAERPEATAAPEVATAMPDNTGRPLVARTTFFVKERVAALKLTDTYDILDPATGQQIGIAKEEPPGWAKWLRLLIKKHMMPTAINVYEVEGQPPVLSIRRGFTLLRSKINVVSGDGRSLGYFKSKLISIGGGFFVYDHANQQVAQVKGNWKGWDFRFLNKNGREIGTVSKKWAGLAKELFTSADNYMISLTDLTGAGPDGGALLLAAGLAIDVVYKEND